MSLAVFGVLGSEPEEVPVLPALLQVVADGVQLVLPVPMAWPASTGDHQMSCQ